MISSIEYKVYGYPIEAKSYTQNEDKTLTIRGVASTTNKDYANEIVSPKVLESLAKQAVGINLYKDHNRLYEGGIGAIVDAWVEDNELWIEAIILSEYSAEIKERLDIGMNFGFSISGRPRKQHTDEGLLITDYDLKDITLTYMPMNWDTYGTVEYKSQNLVTSNCLTGACYHALKNNGEKMAEEIKNKNNTEPVETETPLEEKTGDDAGLNEAQLKQVHNLINEFGVELEPRIINNLKPQLTSIAEEAATKSAEIVADRVIAEIKSTNNIVDKVKSDELPDEETDDEVKSEPGIAEPTNNPDDEINESEKSDEPTNDIDTELDEESNDSTGDDLEEKSLEQKIHDEMVNQLNEKSLESKFAQFIKSKKHVKSLKNESTPKRDSFGRNIRYL